MKRKTRYSLTHSRRSLAFAWMVSEGWSNRTGGGRNEMKCNGEKHRLEEIYCRPEAHDGLTVVRWRKDCGAVVVDYDQDRRTSPGYYMEMKFPTMTYPNQLAVSAAGQPHG